VSPAEVSTAAEAPIPALIQRITSLMRANGHPDAAEAIVRLLNAPARQKPAVYVAGEAKRGKSSLVNALLGQPDLSPVGEEATTATPITFFQADSPQAIVYHFGQQSPSAVDFEQARSLATVAGNPGNEQNLSAVAIGTDSPALDGFNLVDTPGVGGLGSGHGALTLQSLNNADALLFVVEAGAQIRAAELQFLRNAAARVDTVILVLAKTDAYRGWRSILNDNLKILREQAPRFASCPVVPVSSILCLRAFDYPDDAAELRRESGMTDLEQVLAEQVVARSGVLRLSNVLRAGLGALATLERPLQQRLAVMQSGAAGRVALEAEQRRLHELNEDKAEWPRLLEAGIRKLTLERQESVSRQTIELRRRYEERLKNTTNKDFDALPGEVIADLTALGSSVNEMTAERLTGLVRSMLEGLDETSSLEGSITQFTAQSLKEEFESLSLGSHGMTRFEKLSLFNTFSSGRSMGSLLSGSGLGVTASALVAPPIALALGFAVGGIFAFQAFRVRSRQAYSSEFTSWMRDQISQAQLMINNSFARGSIDLQAEIRSTIRSALAEREREINESLTSAKAMMAAEAGRRQQTQQDLRTRLETAQTLKKEVAALLLQLSAGPADAAGAINVRGVEGIES